MAHSTEHPVPPDSLSGARSAGWRPPRRRWPGLLGAALIGAAISAAAIYSHLDGRSIGSQVDAGLQAAQAGLERGAEGLRGAAGEAALGSAAAASSVVQSLQDAGISAAVKTALAADPVLSAWRIDVTTRDGIVTLTGPAPDERSRERAEVLAKAPVGVRGVDNRLALPQAASSAQAMPAVTR